MKLSGLLDSANAVTDEQFTFDVAVHFINDCIAKINIQCESKFPLYTSADANTEPPIPEKWQVALFVPFIAGRIKQVDSSQFEYTQFFNDFYANLAEFYDRYEIPVAFADPDQNPGFAPDFAGNWNIGDW